MEQNLLRALLKTCASRFLEIQKIPYALKGAYRKNYLFIL
jgi:hypothetical protein